MAVGYVLAAVHGESKTASRAAENSPPLFRILAFPSERVKRRLATQMIQVKWPMQLLGLPEFAPARQKLSLTSATCAALIWPALLHLRICVQQWARIEFVIPRAISHPCCRGTTFGSVT